MSRFYSSLCTCIRVGSNMQLWVRSQSASANDAKDPWYLAITTFKLIIAFRRLLAAINKMLSYRRETALQAAS